MHRILCRTDRHGRALRRTRIGHDIERRAVLARREGKQLDGGRGVGETLVSYRSRHRPGVHRVRPVVANRSWLFDAFGKPVPGNGLAAPALAQRLDQIQLLSSRCDEHNSYRHRPSMWRVRPLCCLGTFCAAPPRVS